MPPPTPTSPSPRKRRRKREDPQSCLTHSEEYDSDEGSSFAEVERFQGKIVYNLDGKAYIIDSENELPLQLNDNSIKESNNPKIHSFRVISSRDATMNTASPITSPPTASSDVSPRTTPSNQQQQQHDQNNTSDDDGKDATSSSHRQKPILMCFICKLSFGHAKLFATHASSEHKLNLSESEKTLLCRECSSAIIQKNADDISQISFLEPLDAGRAMSDDNNSDNNNNSNNENDGTDNGDENEKDDPHHQQHPRLTPKSLASLQNPITTAASVMHRLAGDLKFLNSQADLSQLTNFLEQQKTLTEFLSQQQQQSRIACPEHIDMPNLTEIDCKNCEFLNLNQMSPLRSTSKSPMKGFGQHQESNSSSKTSSPITSSVTPNSAQQQISQLSHQMAAAAAAAAGGQGINTSPSFTIGACPDHMNGRPLGVECARCEILLNSARLNSGQQMSTRNSCKTLKCPQCNWHYKYQETLEIHMREKHPDGESACGYCLAGAAHPRLARGESYTCGYKPYRCEICNYSTTTKGNLSIHMQSDKHLNNVQELNNSQTMSVAPPPEIRSTPQPSQPSVPSAPSTPQLPTQTLSKPKPKPSFRCEPCSYETPNARNYRIHETSEKHTHNLAVVQCNLKRLQSHMESFLKHNPASATAGGGGIPGLDQTNLPGAALADLAYNQALLIQLLHGANPPGAAGFLPMLQQQQQQQQAQTNQSPLHFQQQQQQQQLNGTNNQEIDQGLNPDTLEPPFEQDFNPTFHFSCLICSNFNTNDLEELNNHINEDRSRLSFPQEFIVVVNNNNYTCRLCCYKTHLKANCQLHCKTDKHLQRVNFANHIKQGGLRNEYKFDYVINSTTTNNNYNITQLKCNCCDYYTNSIQKLNCHTQNIRHESMRAKFNHLLQLFKDVKMEMLDGQDVNINKALHCQLCNFKSNNVLDMIRHNKSLRHIQIEQIYCLQRRCESLESMDLGDIYQLVDDINLESPQDYSKEEEKCAPSPASAPSVTMKEPQPTPPELQQYPLAMLKMIPFEQLKALTANLPPSQTVFKCNHCDHLCETKHEIEQHFEVAHSNVDCMAIPLPSMAALMAAAQMNFSNIQEPKIDESKVDDLTDKMLVDDKKDSDEMTCEPDIDGVIINSSSRSSSAVSMLHQDDSEEKRATPQKKPSPSPFSASSTTDEYSVMCPLCQESFTERKSLENHVMGAHSVNSEGLNRLLQLVDTSHWNNNKKSPSTSAGSGDYECLVCSDTLKSMNDLLMHATDHSHFTITGLNQFGCLLKTCSQKFTNEAQVQQHFRTSHLNIVISERHVYKYRCPMCPLAFKTEEKLNNHFMYHSMRDATKCNICSRNFRSTTSLQRHIEQVHSTPSQDLNKSTDLTDDERMQTPNDDAISNEDDNEFEGDQMMPDAKRFKAINRSEKVTNYSLEKYHDPNRPFKCEDCFESFTQANILAVHKNSVSHLHRVNKKKQGEASHSGSSTPALGTSPNQVSEFDRRSVDFDRKSIDFEMEISNSMEGNKRKLSSDNDYDSPKKRFKCDICKVAYAQGSTLDIHMRSVGHQAKANRIMQQQQQMQQSSSTSTQPQDLAQQLQPSSNNGNLSPKSQNNNQMYKALLENFGFDIVKQFNEISKTPVKNNGNVDVKKEENEALDFSQASKNENDAPDPIKLFNAEMLAAAQKQNEAAKFDPAMLAQRLMEQQFLAQFPQFAQSLQNLNTGNVPMNTLEMLNLMQFHHLMSLNFMNLAPPLIFGGAQQSPGAPNSVLAPPKPVNDVQVSPVSGGATTPNAIALLAQQQAQQAQLTPQVKKNQKDFIDPWNGINDESSSSFQACASQKRARTRITDDQLKILRSNFDINNSPSEEAIIEMSKKANLPQKVVKHWFRNTLFKERQRNKDSPYNFANPPSTTLNLEEYERTGQTKVVPLADTQKAQNSPSSMLTTLQQQQQKLQAEQQQQQFFQQQSQAFNLSHQAGQPFPDIRPVSQPSSTTSNERDENFVKSEPNEENDNEKMNDDFDLERFRQHQAQQQLNFFNSYETKSESGSSDILSRPQTPNSLYNNINDVINQQIESIPINNISSPGGGGGMNQMGPPKKFQLNKIFDKSYESNSSSSNSSTSSGKRANRTRFTDYQIKVLQEFFENNSYPKDSDLEYLSKLLLLSPRVIVVWFQNARQKQRKIYENQPNPTNSTPYETEDKKAACINYTCKKCNLIFQRYYELIRHQKNHCFKEENNKKSAKAQIAAAQVAQSLSSEDSNSSLEINHASNLLGNNLLPTPTSSSSPVVNTNNSSTSTSQLLLNSSQNLTKMNHLNHPATTTTTTSTSSNNININMQPLDFHQQSVPPLPLSPHNQLDNLGVEMPLQGLHPNFEHHQQSSTDQSFHHEDSKAPFNAEQMQEFLLQKFSSQDFDLLTKNYDFFLQYYKANCPSEQLMDEKHLSMDFLTQFYHLSEFQKKLNGVKMDQELNLSDDELTNENDEVMGLDEGKGKMGVAMHNNKRLRTTILPEQLNFLYECYQKESNPSRKQLEEIAKKVNLKKRVVQVWYQNSRARERKGQFRQNMQIINKKCPYCSAIFKVKSALESHLQSKHPDKQMINIDNIPELSFNPISPQQLDGANIDFWKSRFPPQHPSSSFQNLNNQQTNKRSDFSESEVSFTDSNNEEILDEDCEIDNFNDDEEMAGNSNEKEKSKRHRTHVNRVQKSILRKIFDDIKNPSMIDCENIGREIGLFKRVVQVWFQNARANFKKFHKITTNDLKQLPEKNPNQCGFCPDYTSIPGKSFNVHVTSQQHIQNIHAFVMKNEEALNDEEEEENFNNFNFNEQQSENLYTNSCHPSGNSNVNQQNQQQGIMIGDMHWME